MKISLLSSSLLHNSMQVMAKDVSSRISPRGSVETKEIAALEVLYSPKFPKHGGFWNRYFQFFISSHLMSEVQAVCHGHF